jgi:uncharacterized protein (DUF2267 family)
MRRKTHAGQGAALPMGSCDATCQWGGGSPPCHHVTNAAANPSCSELPAVGPRLALACGVMHKNVFDHATQKADVWIRDMMRELGTDDRHEAHHALSAALHALRDRLSVDEAAQLSAQLPLFVRGLFFERWHPAATPLHVRRPEDLLALVDERAGDGHRMDAERAVASTFEVLRRHVSSGELVSLARVLPPSLAELAR